MIRNHLALVSAVSLLCSLPGHVPAASYNCNNATSPNEILICSDAELSALDDKLAAVYREAKIATTDAVNFKRETNSEWRRREKCADRDCLVQWYQHRSAQLSAEIGNSHRPAPGPKVTSQPPQAPVTIAAPVQDNPINTFGAVIAAALGGLWLIRRARPSKKHLAPRGAEASRRTPEIILTPNPEPKRRQDTSKQFVVRLTTPDSPEPRPTSKPISTSWIRPGQLAIVHGISIPGGMLYVGNTLVAPNGSIEPAQIDPTLAVDSQPAAPDERLFGYWPRYDGISPTARRAYLTWLVGGRCDPNANIGYVFLFFYGLERRLLLDGPQDPAAKSEVPAIVCEIERLRSIYNNGSFLRYSSDLLDFLSADKVEPGLCRRPPPPATANRGMSLRLRVGLGQAAVDARPVPAEWALAWIHSEPNINLPGPARRCVEQFDAQFMRGYREKFGEGLTLSVNRTKLKIAYRPASGGLLHQNFTSSLGDLPDVTTVVTPVKKLQAVVDEAAETLDTYSRFVGRHPERSTSLEATLMLPRASWPASVQMACDGLDMRVGSGMVVIKLSELLTAFGGTSALTRDTLKQLFKLLHTQKVGVEPDVLAGARTPKAEDSVVLFRLAEDEGGSGTRQQSNYDAVAVMLDLALTLANADGQISGREVQFLNRQVDAWSHVGAAAQRRLRARLRLGIVYPPTLSSLKSRIEPLPVAAREALAKLLSALALADGKLRPEAVRHLEKAYQLLGIETSALYSQLHVTSAAHETQPRSKSSVSTESPAVPVVETKPTSSKGKRSETGFRLDEARIAALQMESERVTSMLSKVFEEQELETPVPAAPAASAQEEDPDNAGACLLGLDPEHSAFLRALLARPSWTRAELSDMAADMELMLDGALERVNEAALDAFQSRIAEGDDPIEIARDLMETIDV